MTSVASAMNDPPDTSRWPRAATVCCCRRVLAGVRAGHQRRVRPTGALAGPVASVQKLDGLTIGIGSKNFQEQSVLGKIAAILMRSAGADVKDLTNMPGPRHVRGRR